MTDPRSKLRITQYTRDVMYAINAGATYGRQISKLTGIRCSTLYPLLERLEACGYIETEWEPTQEIERPRAPRKYIRKLRDL